MTLCDRTGDVEAKVWNRARELGALFEQGDVLEVEGDAESYQGQVQISIARLEQAPPEDGDADIFLESSPLDAAKMAASLRKMLRAIENVHLRGLVEAFLRDKGFMSLFCKAPAAKNFHHNYLGGLLEHTLSVCRMAVSVASHYPELDRDLLLAASFLHDVGKVRELSFQRHIDYTDEGRLVGHVVLGTEMVGEKIRDLKDFPGDLEARLRHLIVSHHGQYEFGSPKRPKFLEAFALNFIDDLDAKIKGLGRFMEKDRREGSWTDFNRLFERYLLKGRIHLEEKDADEDGAEEEKQGSLFRP